MTVATRRILRDMREVAGAEQVVSLVSSPCEFWSVSVWSSRHLMQEFMRSGAHGTYMWEVSRWLESFWLMRWRPQGQEVGRWHGITLAGRRDPASPAPGPQALPRRDEAATRRDAALAAIPALRLAYGDGDAPTFDNSPETRWQRTLVAGNAGVLLRLPTRLTRRAPPLTYLVEELRAEPDLLRFVHGRAQARDGGTYLLCLFASHRAQRRLLEGQWVSRASRVHGDALWACGLEPEHEFGHWDGLRVRDRGPLGRAPGQRSGGGR